MELILTRGVIEPAVEDSVYASVQPTHEEKGIVATGAPQDRQMISPRVLVARAEMIAAILAELEEQEAGKQDGTGLPVLAADAAIAQVQAAVPDQASGLVKGSGL